jgi:hypothetical protein
MKERLIKEYVKIWVYLYSNQDEKFIKEDKYFIRC